MTNRERLMSLSDIELAQIIHDGKCSVCAHKNKYQFCLDSMCVDGIAEWLQKE